MSRPTTHKQRFDAPSFIDGVAMRARAAESRYPMRT